MEPQEKLKRLCLTGGSIFVNFEVLRLGSFEILKRPQERPQRPPARPAPTSNVIQEQQIRTLVCPLALDELSFNREAQEKLLNAPRLAGVAFL